MKIYIVGTVGSGKSTLSDRLSELLEIPVYHLDDIVHVKNEKSILGNTKRTDKEIECIFKEILSQENFIIEDTLRNRFTDALHQVDKVVFLDLPLNVLKYRVLKRFVKQKLGIEKSSYKPSLQFLHQMLIWLRDSPRGKVEGLSNVLVLKNSKEIRHFIQEVENEKFLRKYLQT